MVAEQGEYKTVVNTAVIESLLSTLIETGGVSLCLSKEGARPEPIVLMEQHVGQVLVMDLSSVDYLLHLLQAGTAFYLRGQAQGKVLRTPLLYLTETRHAGGRFLCCSDYPSALDVLQRRESFRAELRMGMTVAAGLHRGDVVVEGELRDLSQEGCLLELPMAASGLLAEADGPLKLTFSFPDGTYFEALVNPRHQKANAEHHLLRVGFNFVGCDAEQERQIWYFVCEIEREAARYQKEAQSDRQPSPLFTFPSKSSGGEGALGSRDLKRYATPAARRLVKVAAYLNTQLLHLQQGSDLDGRELSRYADRVLDLHEEDREALLFATRCMSPEPLVVRHGIAVAIHLLDLVGTSMPRDLRKAIVASGLIHDLGKALVPQVLFKAPHLEARHREAVGEHVSLLLDRLNNCRWLSVGIAQAVIGKINERMDGSGYPEGLSGADLSELAKASAVVDVVEAMRRDRADRPAKTMQQIYRHLLQQPHQFDMRWIRRYIEHFKGLPIGSLARFSSQQQGWVLRLDARGNPTEVLLASRVEPPMSDNVGAIVRDSITERLGRPVGEIAVST
ncbi:MAG: phosphohydrolase [Halomonas sp.]|nr:HD domain-containing phosphohydrolase [Halomonas sp.]TVP50495.1 MAG: phosphohydrolase [Halomonas sp.]